MFGYIRPMKSEMRVKEYRGYKAVYCELCRVLGKEYGFFARLCLSYDLTFYALLSLSVTGAALSKEEHRCPANPLKKCACFTSKGDDYGRAAALSVLLSKEKLRDNALDEKGWKRLLSRFLFFLCRRPARRAGERYPELARLTEAFLPAQQAAEGQGLGPDACAEPTAVLLREVFSDLAQDDPGAKAALGELGYFLGRWVYLMDAGDDLPEDLSAGRFNPFIRQLGLSPGETLSEEKRKEAAERMNESLNANVYRMILSLNLLSFENLGPVVENVIRLGLPEMQREILFLRVREKPRRFTRETI